MEATAQPLRFEELQELVEASSPVLRLERDAAGIKGRFLVARRPIKVGEVVLSEWPLFFGGTDAKQSRKVYDAAFIAEAESCPEGFEVEDDCLHPCSPLVDCVAGILLEKQRSLATGAPTANEQARAVLRLRKFAALWRVNVKEPVPEGTAADLMRLFRPDLRALTSEQEVYDWLHVLSSNRFGSPEARLDVMFAGSMFEHSCMANCFAANTWRAPMMERPREYRALRDIEVGEPLSVDYLLLPTTYLDATGRAAALAGWAFSCTCPRCTSLPEVTRAFTCGQCGEPELCPRLPGREPELVCRACGQAAEASYASRCLAAEAALLRRREGAEGLEELSVEAEKYNGLIGQFHHAAFDVAWHAWSSGIDPSQGMAAVDEFREAAEAVIDCVTRLHGSPWYPHLLPVYHSRALLERTDIDEQRHFLDLERAVIRRFYPEESELQDAEIMQMVQRKGPPGVLDVGSIGCHDHATCPGDLSLSAGFPHAPEGLGRRNEQAQILPAAAGDWALNSLD